ncbi:hypothetical protein Gasu2_38200 [Galdieria sulphuraria]|uniref:Uncharacterized protein n=1 Tax=Galdieria sulphuraria TaxID=130081 RepID=M2XPL2_GALSU|nr:uncharacterized protein Gasu_05660 [Galdieria sulphuraria]EME32152.1 hypothetical protein Gasu_05660 [Galdieria sulphuraria]GJD09575.1 hypothetical protein Gasu2_38200 [Galdieria sulphuraria]|eukprot:XP_005708672.1 hypothetical protein Gasu_05660 [Galdieria sulphuraria]
MFFTSHSSYLASRYLTLSCLNVAFKRGFAIEATCKEVPDTSKREFPAPSHFSPQAQILRQIRRKKEFWSNTDNVIERTPEDKELVKKRSEMVVKMLGCEIDERDNFEVKDRVTVGELLASLGHKIPGYSRPNMGPCFFVRTAGYEWSSGVDEGVKMVKEGDARELVGLKNSGPLNFVEIEFKEETKDTREEREQQVSKKVS